MLFFHCDYFYNEFLVRSFNMCYFTNWSEQFKQFEINIFKIEICLTIINKTNIMPNQLHLLFAD